MRTYEISKEELNGAEPICYGYKVIKWDSSTMRGDFKYGETDAPSVGKIFKVDGDIKECHWGLHFSKDPAYVFNFYEPSGYNRYFKIAAYENVIDSKDGAKSVAQCIEFVEEYDIVEFIEKIKKYDRRSTAVRSSAAVDWSTAVNNSTAVSESSAVNGSTAVSRSTAVNNSAAVDWSTAVSESTAVNGSYGLRNCCGMYACIFCVDKKGGVYMLFNKKSAKERIDEVLKKIENFDWQPQFANWYDIKRNKKWWSFCFPQLQTVANDIAWGKMPKEMLDYIKNLPEFDEKVWEKLTGK